MIQTVARVAVFFITPKKDEPTKGSWHFLEKHVL